MLLLLLLAMASAEICTPTPWVAPTFITAGDYFTLHFKHPFKGMLKAVTLKYPGYTLDLPLPDDRRHLCEKCVLSGLCSLILEAPNNVLPGSAMLEVVTTQGRNQTLATVDVPCDSEPTIKDIFFVVERDTINRIFFYHMYQGTITSVQLNSESLKLIDQSCSLCRARASQCYLDFYVPKTLPEGGAQLIIATSTGIIFTREVEVI